MSYYVINNRTRSRGPWFASVESATLWIHGVQAQWREQGMSAPNYSIYYSGCPDAVLVV